jgi:hypothetical protein
LKNLEIRGMGVDQSRLKSALERYDGSEETRHVVARQARDLADSGRIAEDFDYELTVADVLDNLDDAPDGHTLAERWNWWIGSLEVSHGGYHEFRVRV